MELFRLFGSILIDNDEANRSIQNTNDNAESLGSKLSAGIEIAGKWGMALGAAAGTAAIALGALAFNSAENLSAALNGVQASTGKTTEEMELMRKSMLDIYNNNFGESFEDIGQAMQIIAQQTNLTGDALTNTTQNAIMIRDTFGIEVSESIRSVNQLMKNFGIDSDEAYNLLSQGAQSGLNANENLADSINEYSVHFAQLGFGAEEMFNMFSNGAIDGVFDIDKLGDAVKEFGIRSKDMSDGTLIAFESLGLSAEQISADFALGGEKGKAAFELVAQKLSEMKDPLKQVEVGTALFGTMWEDVGAKGVLALTNTKGQIDVNKNALTEINNIKYDTFGEAMIGIKRQLETGILIPLGEKILPLFETFSTWIQNNMPTIIEKIKETANSVIKFKDDTVALLNSLTPLFAGIGAGALTFGIYTLAINASAIATTLWTTVTGVATAAGTAFGAVLAFITSPIGLVVIAIGALVAAGVLLYQNWDEVSAFLSKTWEWIKETAVSVFNSILDFFKEYGLLILAIITGPVGWAVLLTTAIIKNWDKIKETTIEIFNAIKQWIIDKFTEIKVWLTGSLESFKQIGKDIFNYMWDGLKNVWNNISTWMTEKVNWIKDKLTFWDNSQKTMSGGSKGVEARAKGGSVMSSTPYLVGELGPELFIPNNSGTIIPNNRLTGNMAGGVTVQINNPTLLNQDGVDLIMDEVIGRLRMLGVTN
jgi:phage-related minor tail protein